MANIFFISDTHFSHGNIITFKDDSGKIIRPFDSIKEHDEHIVQCWNEVVGPQDHIWHLGDIAMHKRDLAILDRCNGHKRLVPGNHDICKMKDYMKYLFRH